MTNAEHLLAALPHPKKPRRETIASAHQEVSVRPGLMDRQIAGPIHDIRHLRREATRELTEQGKRLELMELHI